MAEIKSTSEVKFNQAGYQQERINDLMRVINFCWINPTKFNERFEDYNYRIIFRVLTSYYTEIRVKFDVKEKKGVDDLMQKLDDYIEVNPIILIKKNSSMYNVDSNKVSFNIKAWNTIKKCLLIYQNKILDGAEQHGMGNPTKKDITKAVLDM